MMYRRLLSMRLLTAATAAAATAAVSSCTQVYSMPLVGVWVKGPSSVLHPLVAAACLRFAFSSLLADMAVNPDSGAFLLLLCPEGEVPKACSTYFAIQYSCWLWHDASL
jgi:hypothetical protein